ncbi:hypothetical protein B566_EDAN008658 [Ephemera danica]|nr:hypothetical protein B566_EDAN008658 [Ephemera danica]
MSICSNDQGGVDLLLQELFRHCQHLSRKYNDRCRTISNLQCPFMVWLKILPPHPAFLRFQSYSCLQDAEQTKTCSYDIGNRLWSNRMSLKSSDYEHYEYSMGWRMNHRTITKEVAMMMVYNLLCRLECSPAAPSVRNPSLETVCTASSAIEQARSDHRPMNFVPTQDLTTSSNLDRSVTSRGILQAKWDGHSTL